MLRRIIFLICFGMFLFGLSDSIGVLSSEDKSDEASRPTVTEPQSDRKKNMDIKQMLSALGYLDGYEAAPEQAGVTIFQQDKAYQGFNLFVSGHAPEAYLMDMTGRVCHTWRCCFEKAFGPDKKPYLPSNAATWRRVHLFPNGDLLAVFEGEGLVRLDADSNILWSFGERCHHDLYVDDNGAIYVLTREARIIPELNKKKPVVEDFVVILDADGNVQKRISILSAFKRSSYEGYLNLMPSFGDVFHTNTIEVLDGSCMDRLPAFKKGNILLSMRNINVIAVLDPDREEIVWGLSGQWVRQHDPSLLKNGHILLFDNLGYKSKSKVIEIDPLTQKIIWNYHWTPENHFFSNSSGACHRLPNGNTLIVESNRGKAFEVTPNKDIVWMFINPHRAKSNNKYISTLFDLERIPKDFIRFSFKESLR